MSLRTELLQSQPITGDHVKSFMLALCEIASDPCIDPTLKNEFDIEYAFIAENWEKDVDSVIQRYGEMLLIFLTSKSFLEAWEREPGIPDNLRCDLRKGLDENDSVIFANQLVKSTQISGYFGWEVQPDTGPRRRYPSLHEPVEIPADKAATTAHIVTILQAYKKSAHAGRWNLRECHPNSVTTERDRIRQMFS